MFNFWMKFFSLSSGSDLADSHRKYACLMKFFSLSSVIASGSTLLGAFGHHSAPQIPQNGSTGLTPLNSERPMILSMTASITASLGV